MEDLEDMCSIRQFKAFVFDMDGLIFDSGCAANAPEVATQNRSAAALS